MKKVLAIVFAVFICCVLFCGCTGRNLERVNYYEDLDDYEKMIHDYCQVEFLHCYGSFEETADMAIEDMYQIVFVGTIEELYVKWAEENDVENYYGEFNEEYHDIKQEIEERYSCSWDDVEDVRAIVVQNIKDDTDFTVFVGKINGVPKILYDGDSLLTYYTVIGHLQ